MRHSYIKLEKNTVTKTAAPGLMRVEIEKTRRAFEIGRDCGFFRVPEILEYDEAKGVAVFERIQQISPVRNVANGTRQYKSLMEHIGRSLAVIHQELALPRDMIITLPPEYNLPGTEVFIHGDFNGINVCVSTCSPSIVILDWQMTSRHGGQATYGSRYFDLIWFVNYMLWTPTIFYLFYDPVSPISRSFLKSYFKESELAYEAEIFVQYARGFFETKLPFRKQHASWRTRYLLTRSDNLTQKFIESLESKVLGGNIHLIGDEKQTGGME